MRIRMATAARLREIERKRTACRICDHDNSSHRELAYLSEGYKPLNFHCRECGCVVVEAVA